MRDNQAAIQKQGEFGSTNSTWTCGFFFTNSQIPAKPKSYSHHRKCLHQKSQRLLGD